MINVGEAIGYLDLDTKGFQSGLKSALQELKDFQDKSKSTSDRLGALESSFKTAGSTLSKNLTIPLAGFGAGAITAGIQFESAFAGVKKTVDATEEQLADLREGILEMSEKMPQSASEISAVAEAAGQLGIHTENILGFTETMVMLGDATNMSSEEAATALARLANITQMPQENFDKLGSTIVALGNNLATTESEIVDMGLNIAAAGAQVGMSEDQILAFAGALSSVGIEAQAGGTSISKVMVDMQLAVEKGGTALNNFAAVANMSAEDFKKAFKEDAASAIMAFITGLQDTSRLGKSSIAVLSDLGIEEVRMRDALLRAAGAGDLFAQSLELSSEAWSENVALSNEASQRYETTASKLKMLWNQVTNLGIKIANLLIPTFKKLVSWLTDVIDKISSMDENTLKLVTTIGAILAAIGPVFTIFSKFIGVITTVQKLVTVIKSWEVVTKLMTVAQTALNLVLNANPVGLVITAVALLTVGVVALSKATYTQTEEQVKLNKAMRESEENYNNSIKNIDDETASMMSNAEQARVLTDEMYRLSEQDMDVATKKELLNQMLQQLKELIPDVAIEIDNETGKIKTQKSEVENLIDSYINLAIAKSYSEKMTAEAKRYTEALQNRNTALQNAKNMTDKLAESKKKLAELEEKSANVSNWDTRAKNNLNIAVAQQRTEVNKLQKEFDGYSEAISQNNNILTDSTQKMKDYKDEQSKLETQVKSNLSTQVEANKKVEESNKKVGNSAQLMTQDQIEASKKAEAVAKKAQQEKEKEAEKSLKAEKTRYENLKAVNKTYLEDVTELNETYAEKLKDIQDDEAERIEEVTKKYEDALQSRRDNILGSVGLFDEFEKDSDVTGKQLLKNLEGQVKGIQKWRQNLQKLSEKGVTDELLEELQNLGPSAAAEIQALTTLSEPQLDKYVELWKTKRKEATEQAELELSPMKEDTDASIENIKSETSTKIDELNEETNTKLDELLKTYRDKLADLGVTVSPIAEESGIQIIKAIELGVDETEDSLLTKLNDLKDDVADIVRQIKASVRSAENAASSIGASEGSHRNGLDYVPHDGYRATLHKGERVLTQQENREYSNKNTKSSKQTLNVNFTGTMGQLIRVLKPEFTLEDDRGGVEY